LVREDDVVIDVGAHVGVFVATALSRGARIVVAVEPDPRNVECLRRNFPAEIDAGRVRVVAEGAWSSVGTLQLHLGTTSAWNSFVTNQQSRTIDVPVRPLDEIVKELALERVDYIKMDIEGAEREALKGSMGVLKRDHPTVMLDSHQLADDMDVLPELILGVDPRYRMICGACQFEHNLLVPHVTFYRYGD
jgi:FkbM family methyltransferase